MPYRRRDPAVELAMLVDRLGRRRALVTLADLQQAAGGSRSRLAPDDLPELIDAAVADSLLLMDLRTFYDRKSGAYTQAWVYRVNARHPVAAELLADSDS